MTAYPARSPDRPTRTDPTDPPVRARYAHGSTRTVRGGVLVRAHHGDEGAWTRHEPSTARELTRPETP